MTKEAEFALKQAFAYCPFSPEAMYHLMAMYSSQRRLEDIRLILKTAQKLDPHNDQLNGWLQDVERSMASQQTRRPSRTSARRSNWRNRARARKRRRCWIR